MGRSAVKQFGRAGGAGAIGSEEDDEMTETTNTGATTTEKVALEGGPADTPATFAFKFKDMEFKSQAELEQYIEGLGTQIEDLKSKPVTVTSPVTPARTEPAVVTTAPGTMKRLEEISAPDLVNMMLSNPDKFVQALKSDIRNEYQIAEQSKQNISNMWEQFWAENKELKPYEGIVKMVFNGNLDTLGPMKMADVPAKLAELSRNTVMTINKDAFKPSGRRTDGKAIIEGGGTAASVKTTESEDQPKGPQTLSAGIKARQAARRAASQPQQRQPGA